MCFYKEYQQIKPETIGYQTMKKTINYHRLYQGQENINLNLIIIDTSFQILYFNNHIVTFSE